MLGPKLIGAAGGQAGPDALAADSLPASTRDRRSAPRIVDAPALKRRLAAHGRAAAESA